MTGVPMGQWLVLTGHRYPPPILGVQHALEQSMKHHDRDGSDSLNNHSRLPEAQLAF